MASVRSLLFENLQVARQILDGPQEQVWLRRPNTLRCWEWPQHPNRSDASAPGHFDVFWRVTDVDSLFRRCPQAFQREFKRRRVRLPAWSILGANTHRKIFGKLERSKLLPDATAASTRHYSQAKIAAQQSDGHSRAGK